MKPSAIVLLYTLNVRKFWAVAAVKIFRVRFFPHLKCVIFKTNYNKAWWPHFCHCFHHFFLSIPLRLLSLNFFPWPSPFILDLLSPPPGCFPLHHCRHLLSFGLTQQFLYLCPAHSSLSHTDLHFISLQARSQRSRLDHFSLSLIFDNPKSTLVLINDALQSV